MRPLSLPRICPRVEPVCRNLCRRYASIPSRAGPGARLRRFPSLPKFLGVLLCLTAVVHAQEGGGQSDIGFQRYLLSVGSQRVADISGLSLGFTQFIPGFGVISASAAPALSSDRFRTGDDYFRLRDLPWQGQHWSFTVGDFREPGQLVQIPFTNLSFPEINARGFSAEATHGGRTIGFFFGDETIANTPRVVLRQSVPQTVQGAYIRQKIGSRLVIGARLMRFSTDLAALRNFPSVLTQGNPVKKASTVSLDALYRISGPLKWYTDIAWSASQLQFASPGARKVPFSTLTGPLLETRFVRLRANYTVESASYFPLLGYYIGDRQGPYAEVTVSPLARLDFFATASEYRNNVAKDPALGDFHSSSESGGVAVRLPLGFALNGQLTLLNLSSRTDASSPWDQSRNQQKTVTVSRLLAGHNLRLTARDYNQVSRIGPERQHALEFEDTFRIKRLTLGGGVRAQRYLVGDPHTSLYYHGVANIRFGPFSAYANLEHGTDLQNRTLFATNTISTSVIGASLNLRKHWELQAEAYRNNLITALNPESVFVLQGQGVFIPSTLAALNQWSVYFRVNRRFSWGKAGAAGDIAQYAISRVPLKGTIEGFVLERLVDGTRPAEGIAVSIDGSRTITTDQQGRFRFLDVPEGVHKVSLFTEELAADFDPGPNKERTVTVAPNRSARADLDVVRLVMLQGKVIGPPGVVVDNVAVRIAPGNRYTTPDTDGNFYFYDLREGEYKLSIDEKTLPAYAVLGGPGTVAVSVAVGRQPEPVIFDFDVREPSKPVRNVLSRQEPVVAAAAPAAPPRQSAPDPKPADSAVATAQPRGAADAGVRSPKTVESPPASRVESAQQRYLAGRKLVQAGLYQDAIVELSAALRINPKFARAFNSRGYAWYQLHAYVNAIQDLDQAIRLDPNYANAYHIRALARSAMRAMKAEQNAGPPADRPPADSSADQPTRANPGVVRLAMIQGKVIGPPGVPLENITVRLAPPGVYTTPDTNGNFYFYDLREGSYTLSILEKSLPGHGVLREPNGITVTIVPGRQADPVVFTFDVDPASKRSGAAAEKPAPLASRMPAPSVVAVMPKIAPVKATPAAAASGSAQQHYLAGRKLMAKWRCMDAIAEFSAALRLNPNSALAYNARGYAWFQLHNYANAIQDLDQAIRLDPGYANAHHIRALAKTALGNQTAAADQLRAKELAR